MLPLIGFNAEWPSVFQGFMVIKIMDQFITVQYKDSYLTEDGFGRDKPFLSWKIITNER